MSISKSNARIAIYGGSFDPLTNGHMDVIRQAATMFDMLHVVVLNNYAKTPYFGAERVGLILRACKDIKNVIVKSYDGLLAKYAHKHGAEYSVRGVRNGFDAEYEITMTSYNAQIAEKEFGASLKTIFIPTTRENAHTSSSNIKILLGAGAYKTAREYLPPEIADHVIEYVKSKTLIVPSANKKGE